MSLDTKDYILLEYLAGIDGPAEISEETLPYEIRINFKFFSRPGDHDNIYARLPKLESYGFIKFIDSNYWKITDDGRRKLLDFINQLRAEKEEQRKEAEHWKAEYKLALSTIEANEVQKKAAGDNKIFTLINIIVGALNLVLLVWQVLKAAK